MISAQYTSSETQSMIKCTYEYVRNSKLSKNQAAEILRLFYEEGMHCYQLAVIFTVSTSTIHNLVCGRTLTKLTKDIFASHPEYCPENRKHIALLFNNDQVAQILNLFYEQHNKSTQIASKFNCSRRTIQDIVSGKSYKHITQPIFERHPEYSYETEKSIKLGASRKAYI